MSINDAIFAVVGTQINDGLLAYYKSGGATSDNLDDAEYEFLIGIGYNGTLNDMKYSFWLDNGSYPALP